MRAIFTRLILILMLLVPASSAVGAREGDTLKPIEIDAPMLETWPENLLNENDERAINQRINEARNSGVPLAVRIFDLTLDDMDLPFDVRQHLREDASPPFDEGTLDNIAQSWAEGEAVETSEDANDGIILIVLVPEDRTRTQAVWWIGPNALPLNGLTEENILATHDVMNEQFAQGNMPNGVFVGLLEFSYNIQFGEPERLERTRLQDALHAATIPMAIVTALAGLAIPAFAFWLSRRTIDVQATEHSLSPWEAAALHVGRAREEIPAAMLLEAVHRDEITPLSGGKIQLSAGASNPAIDALRSYADDKGVIGTDAVYEMRAITEPVRDSIESSLAANGAMTPHVQSDRNRMLILIGISGFLAALTTVPSVKAMSAIGVFAIAIAIIGIAIGWWWLSYRRYTTPAGEELLASWLESASEQERSAFDLVVYQDLISDQAGGPDYTAQTQLLRQLRGLGST